MRLWGHLIGRWVVPRRYERFAQEMDQALLQASDPAAAEERHRALLRATVRLGRACKRSYAARVGFAEAVWSWAKIEELVRVTSEAADAARRSVRDASAAERREQPREHARGLHFARNAAKDLRRRTAVAFGHSRSGMMTPPARDTSQAAVEEFGKHRLTAVRMLWATGLAMWAATGLLLVVIGDLTESEVSWGRFYAVGFAVLSAASARAWVLHRRLPVQTRWFVFDTSRFPQIGRSE